MLRLLGLVIIIIASLALAMGVLWILQGLGIVHWPADSFMLGDKVWARNGAMLAAVAFGFLWLGRRMRGA